MRARVCGDHVYRREGAGPNIRAMNTWMGWSLALAGLVAGWFSYGWPGLLMAVSVAVFWLLLQFSRVMRAMQKAGAAPKGQVASAVMLHSRLRKGLKMLDLLGMTGSLGVKMSEQPEVWRWSDAGGVSVDVVLEGGSCVRWNLSRPDAVNDAAQDASISAP